MIEDRQLSHGKSRGSSPALAMALCTIPAVGPGFRRLGIRATIRSMTDYLEFDPATAGRRQVYRLLTGSVVPRPIGWASTISASGVTNLAPFSFFTVVCVIPPILSLTIARNPGGS